MIKRADLQIIKNHPEHINTLDPKEIKDDDCIAYVVTNYKTLRYLPSNFITKSLCELALNTNMRAIRYIPEALLDQEMVKRAVTELPSLVYFVPSKFRVSDIYDIVYEKGTPFDKAKLPYGYRSEEELAQQREGKFYSSTRRHIQPKKK